MRLKAKFLILAAVVMMLGFVPGTTQAAAGGIQISPLTFKYEIKPGESQTGTIFVKNLNSEDLDYLIESENFSVVSDDGAPSFSGNNVLNAGSSLASWITIEKDQTGTVLPSEEKSISFTITAPSDAEPGGHYAAIFAKQVKKTAEGQTQLGISSRVGTLMLVTIPGEVQKSAEIVEFISPKSVWKGPVDFTMKVKNTGNIHFDSTATISVKSMFGKIAKVDMGTHTILPDNLRNFAGTWTSKYPFGRYSVSAVATDANGDSMTKTAVIWALPLVIVVPVLVALVILVWIVFYLKKHLKFVADTAKK